MLHPVGVLRVTPAARAARPHASPRSATRGRRRQAVHARPSPAAAWPRRRDVNEQFAPAQFQDFDDAERLSQPAFEPGHGGIDLSAAGRRSCAPGPLVKRVVRYELITVDTGCPAAASASSPGPRAVCSRTSSRGAAVSQIALSQHQATSCSRSRTTVDGRRRGRSPSPPASTTRVGRDASPARRWRSEYLAAPAGRRPGLDRRAARDPGVRGGVGMSDRWRPTRSCRGCGRARRPDHRHRPRHRPSRPRDGARSSSS